MFKCKLGNAAVNGTANCHPFSSQLKENTRRLRPCRCASFQILLRIQVVVQCAPLIFVQRALQEFKLIESRENDIVILDCRSNVGRVLASRIAQHRYPDGCVNQCGHGVRAVPCGRNLAERRLCRQGRTGSVCVVGGRVQ